MPVAMANAVLDRVGRPVLDMLLDRRLERVPLVWMLQFFEVAELRLMLGRIHPEQLIARRRPVDRIIADIPLPQANAGATHSQVEPAFGALQ